jgi:hypothetical protein
MSLITLSGPVTLVVRVFFTLLRLRMGQKMWRCSYRGRGLGSWIAEIRLKILFLGMRRLRE